MAHTKNVLKFRRRHKGRTNYKKRLGLLKSGLCRVVIRNSNRHIQIQFVEHDISGDKVLFATHSSKLQSFGWNGPTGNIPAAYLLGLLCGKSIKDRFGECILDAGKSSLTKGNIIYGVLKGLIDAGVKIAHSPEKFPSEERIKGEHIQKYASDIKNNHPKRYKKLFSGYFKNNLEPTNMAQHFEEIKKKIIEG